jgi:hypothetical protein
MKVADGVHSLSQDKGGRVHAFLLDDGGSLTLIDALYDADAKLVLAEIEQMGRKSSDLKDGDHIGPLTALTTPGHTPGCLSFYWPAKKALFVGDVVVTWPRVEAGWAGLTLDMKQNRRSVGKLSSFSGVEILGVGHGDPITQGGIEILNKLKDQKA